MRKRERETDSVCVCCIKSQEKDAGIFGRFSYEHSLFASLPFLNDSQSNLIANSCSAKMLINKLTNKMAKSQNYYEEMQV